MALSPTLRAQLELLDEYVDDPEVKEILVAGPDRVFVTRAGRTTRVEVEAPERRIRGLADRLFRALGARPDKDQVTSGRLGGGLSAAIIGGPRGARCPVVRLFRSPSVGEGLPDLVAVGQLSAEMAGALEVAVEARHGLVVVAPHEAHAARFVAALAARWAGQGRRVVRDAVDGPLAIADVAELVVPPETSVEAAMAAAPDVLIVGELDADDWTAIAQRGCPFVAALEAPDGPYALERLVARVLSGDARLSRAAAESLVLASVGGVLELAPGATGSARRFGRPELVDGRLRFEVLRAETAGPASAAAQPALTPDETLGDDESSRTSSFAAAELVEALSQELEAELAEPPEAPVRAATDDASREAEDEPEDEPEDEDDDAAPGRRPSARERFATVTGPPRPSEVAKHVAEVLAQFGDEPSGPHPVAPSGARAADIRTSRAVPPPELDPFEQDDPRLEPGPMDSTQAADVGEMVSRPPAPAPALEKVPSAPTRALPRVDDEGWDEDAPSELMASPLDLELPPEDALEPDEAGATAAGRFDELGLGGLDAALEPPAPEAEADDGPFENEKTPVAPLFDEDEARANPRLRRRPRSSPGTEGEGEGAADEIGDPTRRRRATPERGRGVRRRTGRGRS